MGNTTTKNNEDPGRGRKSSLKSQQDETKDSASGLEGMVSMSYRSTVTITSWLSSVCNEKMCSNILMIAIFARD